MAAWHAWRPCLISSSFRTKTSNGSAWKVTTTRWQKLAGAGGQAGGHYPWREGAVGYTAGFKVAVPAERVTVVDTVGAGDTFDAGILASLKRQNLLTKEKVANLSEQAVTDALTLGAKAAAVTVFSRRCKPPYAHEIGLSI